MINMWRCKHCNGEIVCFMDMEATVEGQIDKEGRTGLVEIIDVCGDGYKYIDYRCSECLKNSENLKDLAVWVEEKRIEERVTKEDLEKKIAKLEEHKAVIKQAREFIDNELDESEEENKIGMLWYIGNLIFKDMSITASELRYTKQELEEWIEEE